MEGKDSFVFYVKWFKFFNRLTTVEDKMKLFELVQNYVTDKYNNIPIEDITCGNLAIDMAFWSIADDLKDDLAKWKATCNKRSIAGQQGGAPKGNKNACKQNKQNKQKLDLVEQNNQKQAKQAKQAEYDNEYECEYEYEYDNECESDINNNSTPTLEEIKAYITANNYKTDADKFYSCYQSKGWKGVEDWKAKVDYWESKDYPQSYNNVNDGWEELE